MFLWRRWFNFPFFFPLPLIAALLFGWLLLSHIRSNLQSELKQQLHASLQTSESALRHWLRHEQAGLSHFVSQHHGNTVTLTSELKAWLSRIGAVGATLLNERGEPRYFVHYQPDNREFINRQWYWRLLQGQQSTGVLQTRSVDDRYLPVLALGISVNDEAHSVLLVYYPLSKQFTDMLKLSRVGNSGETYAFAADGSMLSESRFPELTRSLGLITGESAITQLKIRDPGVDLTRGEKPVKAPENWPLNFMVQSALNDAVGDNVSGYRDYRGVMVAGAWRWLDDYEFGLVTEIDIDEAYATEGVIYNALIFLFLILTISLSFVLYFFKQGEARQKKLADANSELHLSIQQRSRSEEQLRQIIEDAPNAILLVDDAGRIGLANHEAERLFGYDKTEFEALSIEQLVPASSRTSHQEHRKKFLKAQKTRQWKMGGGLELSGVHRDGRLIPVEIGLSVVALNGKDFAMASITDVSAHRELLQQMDKARQEAIAAAQAKSRFLANISHEIRTPLNAIVGYAQLLVRDGVANETQRKQLWAVKNAGLHLMSLINNVLDMSKIETGHLELIEENFDLYQLIVSMHDMMSGKCKQKNIALNLSLDLSSPCLVFGDRQKIGQMLVNLIDNAVKFTQAGAIDLVISSEERWFHFVITDDGPGINPEDMAKLFLPFHQANQRDRVGGTGLGLAITRNLAEKMGGTVTVSNTKDRGCCAHLSLPLEKIKTVAPILSTDELGWRLAETGSALALVVDDVADNREVLTGVLQLMGFQVVSADDGDVAVQIALAQLPVVVMMDIRMPRMNGFDAMKKIRADKEGKRCKLIAVSASSSTLRREDFLKAGFDDFISKPFTLNDVSSTLNRCLSLNMVPMASPIQPVPASDQIPEPGLKADVVWLNELAMATELGELTRIKRLLMEHVDRFPSQSVVVDYLNQLVARYDWQRLGGVVNRALQEHRHDGV